MSSFDNFDNFLKRHTEKESNQIPRDLFQIAVFYKREVTQEISLSKIQKFICGKKVKSNFIFPFYSNNIFMFPKEAEDFIPRFVKQLIGEQKLPEDAIKNNTINYDIIETGIVPLNLVSLERVDEFKNIKF
jgi:hypothetical protein